MSKLDDPTPRTAVRGIVLDSLATVVSTRWYGSPAFDLTYKTLNGRVANQLLYRHALSQHRELPGFKVGGQRRFNRVAINDRIEARSRVADTGQLTNRGE